MHQEIIKKFKELSDELSKPDIVNDIKKYTKIAKEHFLIMWYYVLIMKLKNIEQEIINNNEIINNDKDSEIIKMAEEELSELNLRQKKISNEINELLNPDSSFSFFSVAQPI